MDSIVTAYQQVRQFKQGDFRARIASLEAKIRGVTKEKCSVFNTEHNINMELLISALFLKKASSQINEVVHALGILLSLPHILRDNEAVNYVSLGAGNTGRPFDLETDMRIAEFKFTDWKGGPEAIRQNQLFKDFYLLAEHDTSKERYLYFVGEAAPLKFLRGGRALSSVMSRGNKLWTAFQKQYGTQFKIVRDYYEYRSACVQLVDLAAVVPVFKQHPELAPDLDDDIE